MSVPLFSQQSEPETRGRKQKDRLRELIGLTATPKKDVGHNTYDFFDLEDDMPTYAYEYDQSGTRRRLAG